MRTLFWSDEDLKQRAVVSLHTTLPTVFLRKGAVLYGVVSIVSRTCLSRPQENRENRRYIEIAVRHRAFAPGGSPGIRSRAAERPAPEWDRPAPGWQQTHVAS